MTKMTMMIVIVLLASPILSCSHFIARKGDVNMFKGDTFKQEVDKVMEAVLLIDFHMSEREILNLLGLDSWGNKYHVVVGDEKTLVAPGYKLEGAKMIFIITGGEDGKISFDYSQESAPTFYWGFDDIKFELRYGFHNLESCLFYYNPVYYDNTVYNIQGGMPFPSH